MGLGEAIRSSGKDIIMSRRDAWICIFFGLFAFWGLVAAFIVGAWV